LIAEGFVGLEMVESFEVGRERLEGGAYFFFDALAGVR